MIFPVMVFSLIIGEEVYAYTPQLFPVITFPFTVGEGELIL